MEQDKMYIISKIFNNKTIRTIWSKEDEKYYISIIMVLNHQNCINHFLILKLIEKVMNT